MSRRSRKIIVGVLVIVIGLPVAFILTAWACFSIMDKTNGTIVSSGVRRRYLLYVPKTYDRTKPTPLVISMHGLGLWPAAQMEISQWNKVADEHGFIVVYPSGTMKAMLFRKWRLGPEADLRADVRFISELIDTLEAAYNIDPTRIYANGISNGGRMTVALSCALSHRIAAVGTVAAPQVLPWSCSADSPPVPIIMFHGTADPGLPYSGGRSWGSLFPSVSTWAANWARRNRCTRGPSDTRITASVRRLVYTNCAENADVILYTIEGGGHTWPGGKPLPEWIAGRTTREINASSVMWEFFVQHPRGPK